MQRVFLDVSIGSSSAGRLVIELFSDTVPLTADNFRSLCTGEKGTSTKRPGTLLCYRGSRFHRVIKDFMVQGGDFINNNGTGGESIYNGGGAFNDESFARKHDEPFLLSCANSGPNTNRSQFFITAKPAPHLDGKHVVFGRLVSGFDVFSKMENTPTDSKDKPLDPITITNCGEL
ncbi:cyclophilin-like domain-containing protein, partial [Obelidium mucronatum]